MENGLPADGGKDEVLVTGEAEALKVDGGPLPDRLEGSLLHKLQQSVTGGSRLFPLRLPPKPVRPQGRGHRVRSRYARALGIWTVARQVTVTLNQMGTSGAASGPKSKPAEREDGDQTYDEVESACAQQVFRESRRVWIARRESLRVAPSGVDLLSAFTKKMMDEVYCRVEALASYVPFNAELVSEPAKGAAKVSMLEALPENIARRYASPELLLNNDMLPTVQELNKRYCKVLGRKSEWISYLHREDVRDLWELMPVEDTRASVSVACVPKKDGHLQRKILMSIPFNVWSVPVAELMQGPVDYGLAGGEALAVGGDVAACN